jgi:hypothetical protein
MRGEVISMDHGDRRDSVALDRGDRRERMTDAGKAATGEPSLTKTVPAKPTAAMLAAGGRAGDVSVEVAWRVYQAMVKAAE